MKDIVPGANHDLFAVDTGVAVFGADGRGFGICPLDSPLVSLGEPGGWKYTTNSVTKRATVFVNLFNNQWTTNFRFWNEGTWTSRIRIWMFDRYDPWTSLIKPSLEARFPLQAAVADGPAGMLPLSASGVAVSTNAVIKSDAAGVAWASGGSVLVTAFGANPDGAGTLLRLWETAGQSGPSHRELAVRNEGQSRTASGPARTAKRRSDFDLGGRVDVRPSLLRTGQFPDSMNLTHEREDLRRLQQARLARLCTRVIPHGKLETPTMPNLVRNWVNFTRWGVMPAFVILLVGLASAPAQLIHSPLSASDARVKELQNLRWGMFICWSFSTFSGKEWTPGVTNLALFNPTGCDTEQWVETAKDAGMGYILFLTKHHDGFCLWDTKTTDRKVTKSPLGRDVLAELKRSCAPTRHQTRALFFRGRLDVGRLRARWEERAEPGGQKGATARAAHGIRPDRIHLV
ncbi:MAG: alpha-L-fucosidase [Verrucomicrobiota bacterium]